LIGAFGDLLVSSTVEHQNNSRLTGSSQPLPSTRTLDRPIPEWDDPLGSAFPLPLEAEPFQGKRHQAPPEHEPDYYAHPQLCPHCPYISVYESAPDKPNSLACFRCLSACFVKERLILRHEKTDDVINIDISKESRILYHFNKQSNALQEIRDREQLQVYFISNTLDGRIPGNTGWRKRDLNRFIQKVRREIQKHARRTGRPIPTVDYLWVPEIQWGRYRDYGEIVIHWHIALLAPKGYLPDCSREKGPYGKRGRIIVDREGEAITAIGLYHLWGRGVTFCKEANESISAYLGKYLSKNLTLELELPGEKRFKGIRRYSASREVVKLASPKWVFDQLKEIDQIPDFPKYEWKFSVRKLFVYPEQMEMQLFPTPWHRVQPLWEEAEDIARREQELTDQYGPPTPEVEEVETLPFWPNFTGDRVTNPHELTYSRSIKIEPDITYEETTEVDLQSNVYLMLTLDRGGVRGYGEPPENQAGRLCLLPRPPQAIPNPQPFAPLTILPAATYDPQAWFDSPERAWLLEQHLLPSQHEEADPSDETDPAGGSPPACGIGGDHSSAGRKPRDRTKRRIRE
jgi:hypothetical protein